MVCDFQVTLPIFGIPIRTNLQMVKIQTIKMYVLHSVYQQFYNKKNILKFTEVETASYSAAQRTHIVAL